VDRDGARVTWHATAVNASTQYRVQTIVTGVTSPKKLIVINMKSPLFVC